MTDNLTLADLRIRCDDHPSRPHGWVGPWFIHATREDLLIVLGGEEIRWCEKHEAHQPKQEDSDYGNPYADKCYEWWIGEMNPDDPPLDPCRMVKRLIIPLEES